MKFPNKKSPSFVDPKFLILALFRQLPKSIAVVDEPRQVDWLVCHDDHAFQWRYEDDAGRLTLIAHLSLLSLRDEKAIPPLQDILLANTAIFGAFPATITMDASTRQLRLSWQMNLDQILRVVDLEDCMVTMLQLKQSLAKRWRDLPHDLKFMTVNNQYIH